jgi:nitroreductase/NAD-dependent dihydropyrimidine dehydrogenase PreA subunit
MSIIEINQTTCSQCGICVAECPRHLITINQAGSFPEQIAAAEALCAKCGHCVVVCPVGALSHEDVPLKKCPDIQKRLKVTPEQCEQLLKSRRSVRVFKKEPVSREVVTRLIEDARYAPTGHNAQEVEWLVIDDGEELNGVEELGLDWIRWVMKNQPQLAIHLNMKRMLERQERDHNVFLRGAPVLVVTHASKENPIAVIDSATALAYLDLAANSMGLGTCWAGYVYIMANSFPAFKTLLALPEGHSTTGCMMLGYNKFKYYRIPKRREPKIVWR